MNYVIPRGMTPGIVDPKGERRLAFSEAEYTRRQDHLRALMRRDGIDMLWVTTPDAVAWLHGYYCGWYKANGPMRYAQTYGTAIHAHSDKMIHFDHPTELPLLIELSASKDNRFYGSREGSANIRFIMDELQKEGLLKGTVGMEFWSYLPNRVISGWFETAFKDRGGQVADASAISREARRVKSEAEIALMTKAIAVCDIGHEAILEYGRAGKTELELQGEVIREMMKAGGELPALIHVFNSFAMVDGRVAGRGHSMPSTRKLKAGEMLTADLCGVLNRYHGNVLRGYYIGEPPAELVDLYDKAGGAIDYAGEHLHAGMTVKQVNKLLRAYCEDTGLINEEGWVLGYELGLSLPPDWVGDFYFNMQDELYLDRVFEPGMVTNLEILFSTAMIDTLIWRPDGVENPTRMPRKLMTIKA